MVSKRKAKKPTGGKPGRKPRYRPEIPEQARLLCTMGYTDAQLAQFFQISENTLYRWKREKPEFAAAISEGKEVIDAKVTSALLERALGYSHPDVHISNFRGEVTVTPIVKHYPPDTPAALFWLSNRQPHLFKKDPTPATEDPAEAASLSISFEVSEPVREVRVTNAKA